MYPIAKVFSLLGRLWPLLFGVSLTWFGLGFWGQASQARATIFVLENRAAGSGASRSEAILQKNILKLDNPAPQGPVAGPDPNSWKLLGIIAGDRPMVLLLVDGKAKTIRIGEQVSGWTLQGVQHNAAQFQSGSLERSLVLFQQTAGPTPQQQKNGKSKMSLAKTEIDPVLTDPGALLQQALFKPNVENSKTVGYRIDNIQDNSILKRLGFQNGDILMRINGDPIDGPGKMMQLYAGLKSAQALNLDIKRGAELVSVIVELN